MCAHPTHTDELGPTWGQLMSGLPINLLNYMHDHITKEYTN